MFSAFLLLIMTSYINADEMDATTLEKFQSAIYGAIMAHVDAEYQILQPVIAQQNESMNNCREQIRVAQDGCKACASHHCSKVDLGELVMGGLKDIGDWLKDSGKKIVDWRVWKDMGNFFDKVGNWLGDATKNVINWGGFDDMRNFFSGIGNAFSSGFNAVKNVVSNVGESIGSGISSIGNVLKKGLGSLFGRRRRDIRNKMMDHKLQKENLMKLHHIVKRNHDETQRCMAKCNECTPFLGDETTMIKGVCGDQILADQESLAEIISKLEALYNANGNLLNGEEPIVSKIEFDKTDFSFDDFSLGGVYVTAVTPICVVRYPSQHRYKLQTPEVTAELLAQELINKWN